MAVVGWRLTFVLLFRRRSSGLELYAGSGLPLRGYFSCVGGALLALLFVADATLPSNDRKPSSATLPTVRIHSAVRWPARVVIDTNELSVPTPKGSGAGAETNPIPLVRDEEAVPESPVQIATFSQRRSRAPETSPRRGSGPKRTLAKAQRKTRHIQIVRQTMFGSFASANW